MSKLWFRSGILSPDSKGVRLPKVWTYLEREREVSGS